MTQHKVVGADLHSTVVLLKVTTLIKYSNIYLFTFYCSSIKGQYLLYQTLHHISIYILL